MEERDGIVKEFVKVILNKTGANIEDIILFGSRAKDTYMPYSDYDLVIVLEEKVSRIINEIYDEVVRFLIDHEVDISLKIYSKEDYYQKLKLGTPFMREIGRYGEVLWSRK